MGVYKLISKLFAWIFPVKADRQNFRIRCELLDYRQNIPAIKDNYSKVVNRLKTVNGKLKVIFLVSEIAKWKVQSLYDLMLESPNYEPVIALTISDFQWKLSKEERVKILQDGYEYFTNKGMNCIYAYDTKLDKAIDLSVFNPDLVFYQQPWRISENQSPARISEFALTFYIPYYVQNYGMREVEACQIFHQTLYRYYILNKEWEDIYSEDLKYAAGSIKGLGHTMLDNIYFNKNYQAKKDYVIYAPHHSINNFENFATFEWNGEYILEYAKSHPEINWVFKPHPTLKYRLLKCKLMNQKQIDEYYKEWGSFATCCYTSDYFELFLESKAMITDCASFLVEYFCTGKPLIHLISSKSKVVPLEPFKRIIEPFYKVHNIKELEEIFDRLLMKSDDYKKEERLNALADSGLDNNYAAKNILDDIEGIVYEL